jgi:hypothetical protein
MIVHRIPNDILETVTRMKKWFIELVTILSGSRIGLKEAADVANILLAYVDGETLNVINGRVLPGEDIRGRVVNNSMRLFRLLTATRNDGIELRREPHGQEWPPFP